MAAPSWVIPANLAENVLFLAGKTDEVGLCLFETQACCAYGPDDIPPSLANLPLRWHVHLPLDLPWNAQTNISARSALDIMDRVTFLKPRLAVLHPPEGQPAVQRRLLSAFFQCWHQETDIPLVLENTEYCDLTSLGTSFLKEHGAGMCLDVGHLLGYDQQRLLASDLPEQAVLLHWSAPGDHDRHLPLTALTPPQRRIVSDLATRLSPSATHMIEVFHWSGYVASLPVLAQILHFPDEVTKVKGAGVHDHFRHNETR
ncbi:MAG: hypothetical protein J5861_08185 [Desulfovibrio sp.]|nr:hypothetical protein [Desulfovibrio sp.]